MSPADRRKVRGLLARCSDEQLLYLQDRYAGTEHEAVIHEERLRRWRRAKAEERGRNGSEDRQ